jgi:phage terminase large subunit GpA-like protein
VGTSHREHYEQETITVSIFDKSQAKIIWTGSASDKVDPEGSPEQRQSQINKLVEAILETFPKRM